MRATNRILVTTIFFLISLGFHLDASAADEGIRFSCVPDRLERIRAGMATYLASLRIAPGLVVTRMDRTNETLLFTLNTPRDDVDTLQLKDRPEFAIRDDVVRLPAKNGKTRKLSTVSRKEILLALLQHGRLTEFGGANCNLDALKELVAIRQNIVAWSEDLNWGWPDGESAEWNAAYWHRGTPLPGVPLVAAFGDAFENQSKYSIGCYAATKLVMVQSVLDYYHRVRRGTSRLKLVEARLASDHDPLMDIEPGTMWSFERDFDSRELSRPGKILQIQYGVAPKNFVPGDWVYLLNTDPVSAQKTGYEGSNAIYLGRNKFDDYYNDNKHAYTYQQKLDEVHQWRNGVFNRVRDAEKIRPLSAEGLEHLSKPPAEGGLVMDFRVFPYLPAGSEGPEIPRSPLPSGHVYLSESQDATDPTSPSSGP